MIQRALLAAAFISVIAASSYAAPQAKPLEEIFLPADQFKEEARQGMRDDVARVGREEVRRCWMRSGMSRESDTLYQWEIYHNCVDSASPIPTRRGR